MINQQMTNCSSVHRKISGRYTDDAEMTLALTHALRAHAGDLDTLTEDTMVSFWTQEYHKASHSFLLARLWSLVGAGRNGHGPPEGLRCPHSCVPLR